MEDGHQPLLSYPEEEAHDQRQNQKSNLLTSSLIADTDIEPIRGVKYFFRAFSIESRKVWFLIGPAVFTFLCRYSLGAITQVFVGHVCDIELAAFAIENSIIAGLSFGLLLGMGSALETLCGQAFAAYLSDKMLKLQMQPTLLLYGCQLYAYAAYFPSVKFLKSQSKMFVMALIALITIIFHTIFSWLLMVKLGWGLAGGAIVLNSSWWFMVVVQLGYIFSGSCGRALSGFSWKVFDGVWSFVRLSIISAIMSCLEVRYFMILILFAGYLKHAKISVDGLAICMNLLGWTLTVAIGCNVAVSIRVSNELGAGHPRIAKFSVVVAVIASSMIGIVVTLFLMITRSEYPSWFTSTEDVQKVVYNLTPLLATSIIINTIQPVLTGVAIGAGWKTVVAYVNIGCYYIFGVPLGLLLGFVANLGVTGIWGAMLSGTVIQTCILFWMTFKTNWNKEASIAESRIRKWGGETEYEKASEHYNRIMRLILQELSCFGLLILFFSVSLIDSSHLKVDPYVSISDDQQLYVKSQAELKEYHSITYQQAALYSLSELRETTRIGTCLNKILRYIISVDQLLESKLALTKSCVRYIVMSSFFKFKSNVLCVRALEVAGQVAGSSISTSPLPYSAMASQCEALGKCTKKKLSNWLTHDSHAAPKSMDKLLTTFHADGRSVIRKISSDIGPRQESLTPTKAWTAMRLPPASPFDNFLKAARY